MESDTNEKFHYCIYHAPCTDGMVAAWVVQKLCPDVELIKCTAGANPTGMGDADMLKFKGKNLIFVDICGTPEYIRKMATFAESIIIIDHHVSYHKNMGKVYPENVFYIFDESKAACQLVWEKLISKRTVPWFIHYVADRDLFTEKMPASRAISQALYDAHYIRSFEGLDKLFDIHPNQVPAFKDRMVQKGSATLVVRNDLIKSSAKSARKCVFYRSNDANDPPLYCWLFTCPRFLVSDVGARLMTWRFRDQSSPEFVVGWLYDVDKHQFKLSFRSNEVSDVDVSAIALQISRGGGGHRTAAACTIPASTALHTIFEPVENAVDEGESSMESV